MPACILKHSILEVQLLLPLLKLCSGEASIWSKWWTYDGFAGPRFWGKVNQEWILCNSGKFQSPIDIQPGDLLFDPLLTKIMFSHKKLNGNLTNTGHDITLYVDDTIIPYVNVSAGPLPYEYHIHQIKFHFGPDDDVGSEHTVNGSSFPSEVQIMAYNAELYHNYSQALTSPNGIAIFAIFVEIGEPENEALKLISEGLNSVPSTGNYTRVHGLPLDSILPSTHQYVTYEGSLTQPGCHESVTWIIFNKPIYILKPQLQLFRLLNQKGGDHQQLLLEGNVRPTMPLNNRLLRTNISYRGRVRTRRHSLLERDVTEQGIQHDLLRKRGVDVNWRNKYFMNTKLILNRRPWFDNDGVSLRGSY